MAFTDVLITDASVGMALPVVDGYLVDLNRVVAPYSDNPPPQASEAAGKWLSGYFVLRDAVSQRAYICMPETNYGYVPARAGQFLVLTRNASLRYTGELIVECVPAGSEWLIRVSDQPNPFIPPPGWSRGGVVLWGAYPNYRSDAWRSVSMGRRTSGPVEPPSLQPAPMPIDRHRAPIGLER